MTALHDDPMGTLIVDVRNNAEVAAMTTRIRGYEPAPGDALGPGSYQRFIVFSELGDLPNPRAGAQEVRYAAKCYGTDPRDARLLYTALKKAVHNRRPFVGATGQAIHRMFVEGGGGVVPDPGTGQPYKDGVVVVYAGTEALAS